LQDAKQQQRLQIPGQAAEHRTRCKQTEADQEEGLAAEVFGEKLVAVTMMALATR